MKKIINLFKNPKVKMVIILSFLLFIYTSFCAITYAENISSNISNNVFRLHVLANSDSKEDQNLKLIVRDSLLNYMNSICTNAKTKQDAIYIVENNKDEFKKIAEQTIKEQGFSYSVNVQIRQF